MEFASEMVVKSSLNGLRVTEVPTTLSRDGRSRPPHLRTWRDGWRHLRFLLMYCPRWLFMIPGLTLMFIGLFVMTCDFKEGWKLGDSKPGVDARLYTRADLERRLLSHMPDCELVGTDGDWTNRGSDAFAERFDYSFATFCVRKRAAVAASGYASAKQ